MVTIKDVAVKSKVSIATVSNVINGNGKTTEETKQRVLNAIKELNYSPNRLSKKSKLQNMHTIGVITEELCTIFTTHMLNGICQSCNQYSYAVQMVNLQINPYLTPGIDYIDFQKSSCYKNILSNCLDILQPSKLTGIIYVGAHPRDVSDVLPDMDIPVSYVFCYTNSKDYCVNNDDHQGARMAVDYLVEHGHRKIGIICGPVNSIPTHRRLSGYQESLMNNHLTLYPEYIFSGDWSIQSGYRAAEHLFSMQDPPTAVFSMNDNMAIGVIKYMNHHSMRTPEELSLVGFDSTYLAEHASPSLTSIHTPFDEMGQLAVTAILEQCNNKEYISSEEEHSILLPCTLDIRESVTHPLFP